MSSPIENFDPTETVVVDSDPAPVGESSEVRPAPEADNNFKPINSQADFETALKQRLARAEKAAEKKYLKEIEDRDAKIAAHETEKLSENEKILRRAEAAEKALIERDEKLNQLERTRTVDSLAREMGLPEKFWSRVQGSTDDEIISDINDMLEGLPKAETKVDAPSLPTKSPRVKVQSTGTDPDVDRSAKDIVDSLGGFLRGF